MEKQTPHLALPLPHPEHLLSEDVLRIRSALMGLDEGMAQQRDETHAALRIVERRLRLMRLSNLLNLGI